MDRIRVRYIYCVWALMLLIPVVGCGRMIATIAYVIRGGNIAKAPFPGLKDKKVVVVCRTDDSFNYSTVSKYLSRRIGALLTDNGKKITVIKQSEVEKWIDEQEQDWEEFTEIGEALGADMVVGIDLGQFRLRQGQLLFQGRALIKVSVYDMSKQGDELVFEESPPKIIWPVNSPISSDFDSEEVFRQRFIKVIADQIGRYFYDHDRMSNFALDPKAL